MDKDIEKLNALLSMDEAGAELIRLLNETLVDTTKRNMLLIKLNEIRKETSILILRSELRFTKSEEAVKAVVLDSKKPLTAQEVSSMVGDELRSLKHTTHTSSVLNSLVSKGILGRFKLGYNYYFTSPREAVNEQLKRRQETPQRCSPAEIAEETGMPLAVVLEAIEELMT